MIGTKKLLKELLKHGPWVVLKVKRNDKTSKTLASNIIDVFNKIAKNPKAGKPQLPPLNISNFGKHVEGDVIWGM